MNDVQPQRRSGGLTGTKRFVVVLMALFLGWHVFATALWVAPSSALREVVPGDALRGYMMPMFGQSWSVFAPEPISADYYFDVRASVTVGGQESVTEWVRASDVELSRATHHPFPPRSAMSALAQALETRNAWLKLSSEQKTVFEANYYEGDDWSARMNRALDEAPGQETALTRYKEDDRAATAYATQVALAVWGDGVQRVQYRVARHPVVSFEERNDVAPERPAPSFVNPGWRGLVVEPGQSQKLFASYFCAAPAQVCEV